MTNVLSKDLDHILQQAGDDLSRLKGRQLFLTGGTGFFGLWLLETIAWANGVEAAA